MAIVVWIPKVGFLTLRYLLKYRMLMKAKDVIEALGALAHEHRLAVYRLLVERGPEGVPAGHIATRLKLAPSSLTFHLQALQRAGLINQRRESRQLIYSADFDAMNDVVGYLTENCCAGSGECAPGCKPVRATPSKRAATA
jgi:ArsR family transcriptional regulator